MSFFGLFGKKPETAEFKVVTQLTSTLLAKMIIEASHQLSEHKNYLNKINVFPVPDGDTGSNMNYTVQKVREELQSKEFEGFAELGKAITHTAMFHSRGNSGTVISQFFKGFCADFDKIEIYESKNLLKSFEQGNRQAWQSFEKPAKGTILDVIEAATQGVKTGAKKSSNLIEILEIAIEQAQTALRKTQNDLPQNRKAGVVDSAGAGFVYMLGGFVSALKDKQIVFREVRTEDHFGFYEEEELTFRYCTECVLKGDNLDEDGLRKQLKDIGDSLQALTVDDYLKFHIHTDRPEEVRRIVESFGVVEFFKAEDMVEQQRLNLEKKRQEHQKNGNGFAESKILTEIQIQKNKTKIPLAVITDTSADLPEGWLDKYPLKIITLPVFLADNETEELTAKFSKSEFYKQMELDSKFVPKTSKAADGELRAAYEELLNKADRVVCLPIAADLSGTYQAALKAKEGLTDNSRITVVDTKTTTVGLVMMVELLFESLEQGLSLDEALERVYDLRNKIQIYFLVDDVIYLERGGRISKLQSLAAGLLRIQPLLSLTDGQVIPEKEKVVWSNPDKQVNLMVKKALEMDKSKRLTKLYVIYAGEKGKTLAGKIKLKIDQKLNLSSDFIQVVELNLVLGSHLGPGAVGVVGY